MQPVSMIGGMKRSLSSSEAKLTLEGAFVKAEARNMVFLFPLSSVQMLVVG